MTTQGVRSGSAVIISAPSGAGKSTIARRVTEQMENVRISISHTTRNPRSRETDGIDYHFVTAERFSEMKDAGAFLETACVHDNWYGTHTDEIVPYLSSGVDVILDIDVQGARIIRKKIDATLVFILPPSMEELMRRLRVRDTEREDVIKKRIENARREIAEAVSYDFLVINDDLSRAVRDVMTIIAALRMKLGRNREVVDAFIGNDNT